MIKKNAERIKYSKNFKRKVLLAISKGMSNQEAFLSEVENLNFIESNDKKYIFKLVHKWKNEAYKNKDMLLFDIKTANNLEIDEEIKSLGSDFEDDNIENKLLLKNSTNHK